MAAMSDLQSWRNRQSPKLSQAKLADLLGTTQPHVSEIENNEDKVSLELAGKIFAATGVRIGKLKDATDQQAETVAGLASAAAAE